MPRLHQWPNSKQALLQSMSDGDVLGSVHASGKPGDLDRSFLMYLKHRNNVVTTQCAKKASVAAPSAANPDVKSP